MKEAKFPRIALIVMGRVNETDTFNNGLLLRNLFSDWPKENLAQIYTNGDDSLPGFFSKYYQLNAKDRFLGYLFYRYKSTVIEQDTLLSSGLVKNAMSKKVYNYIFEMFKSIIIDTGLYEIIFKIRLSKGLRGWLNDFKPDFIFVQGYSLGTVELSLLVAKYLSCPIIYYPTDDWVISFYNPLRSKFKLISCLAHGLVSKKTNELVQKASICLAFNNYMKIEYYRRYGKEFTVFMHGDIANRFNNIIPKQDINGANPLIVTSGQFDSYRFLLLNDAELACEELVKRGYNPIVLVYVVNLNSIPKLLMRKFKYIHLAPSPSHNGLVPVLLGADILFLPERFGDEIWDIKSSVSSKAHLYMYSKRPIVVYSDSATGVARYALEENWGKVIDRRDPLLLADIFEKLIIDVNERQRLSRACEAAVIKNHHLPSIQADFKKLLLDTAY